MSELSVDKDFLGKYAKLDHRVQRDVRTAIEKFPDLKHSSQHLEKLSGAADPNIRTIRINDNHRGVVLAAKNDQYILLTVLPHDKANKYAASKRFTINSKLGVLEVRDQTALEAFEPALQAEAAKSEQRLFDHVKDVEMARLGIDPDILPLVRSLTGTEQLDAMEKLLPATQHGVLIGLAAGWSADEVWSQLCADILDGQQPSEVDTEDFAAAVERTSDQYVRVTGPEELREMLDKPFRAWRLFLHPKQRAVAFRRSFRGPVLISGGPGTGKTVTAVHRAAFLAERVSADRDGSDGRAVLLTTFNRELANSLTAQLEQLVDDDEIRSRVEVLNVDRLANQIVARARGKKPDIVDAAEFGELWRAAAEKIDDQFSPQFLRREWEQVILAQGIADKAQYLECYRKGRGRKLSRPQKESIWGAVSDVLATLRRNGQYTHLLIAEEAARVLAERSAPPYRHVLVDEGQDLHPSQWRLLRRAAEPGSDDLFVVSDPNQRIYKHRVSLNQLGIEVRGRSHKLKVSYRTTQETLNWAARLLSDQTAEGLDDQPDALTGYRSAIRGRRPITRSYENWAAELEGLVGQVREWLRQGVEPSSIGVAARVRGRLTDINDALERADIPASRQRKEDAVRVDTMHAMKGDEYQCTAIVGLDDSTAPLPAAITSAEEDTTGHEQDMQSERSLLFVACTRNRDVLYVSYSGTASPFLPG